MRQGAIFLLLAYFLIGSICLPGQDVTAWADIPALYRQCQAIEDQDMTPLDFITDHLINIDRLSDKHPPGDHQRPHHPKQLSHAGHQQIFFNPLFRIAIRPVFFKENSPLLYLEPIYLSGFPSGIFHPPKPVEPACPS